MKKIKVLIFDLDNTLINYGGVTRRAWEISVHKAMSNYPLPCKEKELVDQIISINDALWENEAQRPHGNFSFYELRKHIVSSAFEQLSITHAECLEFLVVNYSYYKQEAIYVFEDVPVTLQKLRERGYHIALLTNGDSFTQREKLKRFAMEPMFDKIFIDGEQGVGKPDRKAYENVWNAFHVLPEETCMIGDHYLWEVIAPKEYGMYAIWVNRGNLGIKEKEEQKADAIIEQMQELLQIF